MADVQVAVWLWRKAGLTLPHVCRSRCPDHDVSNKIEGPSSVFSVDSFLGFDFSLIQD
jgi:hypothetical protein